MKRKSIRKGALVIVDWDDAHTPEPGWDAVKPEDLKPALVRSAGFVVNIDERAITIAGDGAPKNAHEDSVNRPITIPLGMVRRIRLVRVAECEVLR